MKYLKYILKVNVIKSIFMNFKLFNFKTAIKLPVLFGYHVKIKGCKRGSILIDFNAKTGNVLFGILGSEDLNYFNSARSILSINNKGKLIIKGKASFGRHFSCLIKDSNLIIGKNFYCNNSFIISCCGNGITLGNNVLCGGDVVIRDTNGHKIIYDKVLNDNYNKNKIVIGNDIWICNKSNILGGSSIGDGSVLAYSSFLKDCILEKNCLIAGIPARIIKHNIKWEK